MANGEQRDDQMSELTLAIDNLRQQMENTDRRQAERGNTLEARLRRTERNLESATGVFNAAQGTVSSGYELATRGIAAYTGIRAAWSNREAIYAGARGLAAGGSMAMRVGRGAAGFARYARMTGGMARGLAGGAGLVAAGYAARMTNPENVETQRQTQLLAGILAESRRTARSLAGAQAAAAARADPLGRSMGFFQQRQAQMGIGINDFERNQLAGLADRQGMLNQSRVAAGRARTAAWAPFTGLRQTMATGANLIQQRAYRGVQSLMQSPLAAGLAPALPGGAQLAGAYGLQHLMSGSAAVRRGREDTAIANLQSYQLQRLSARGPGNVLGAAPTVQAGTAGAYQFQGQQQRRALQDELTRKWQERMLAAMERLAGTTGEDISAARLSFQARQGMAPTLGEE